MSKTIFAPGRNVSRPTISIPRCYEMANHVDRTYDVIRLSTASSSLLYIVRRYSAHACLRKLGDRMLVYILGLKLFGNDVGSANFVKICNAIV